MRELEGKVALVTGGGEGVGRAIALALAAHGVRVVVTGSEEKALGETVGEIAFGGGKARHVVADVRDAARVEAAVARAIDVFGGLDLVVLAASAPAEVGLDVALPKMREGGRVVVVAPSTAGGIAGLVDGAARELAARKITCNAILAGPGEDIPEEAAAKAVSLCADAAASTTGQVLGVGPRA